MKRKLIFRSSLLLAAAALVSACFSTDGPSSKYDGYIYFLFEPESIYQWDQYVDTYYNHGADSVLITPYFSIGPVTFNAKLDENDDFTGGFTYCIGLDTLAAPGRRPSRFAVYDKYGLDESLAYAVFHDTTATLMPEHAISVYVPNTESSAVLTLAYVQNVQATVQAALYGDGLEGGPFTAEDYLKLTFTGYKNGKQTGEKSVVLIDGTRPLKEWTEVNLSELSSIDTVDLSLQSSRSDFPLYCCLDDVIFHYIEIY